MFLAAPNRTNQIICTGDILDILRGTNSALVDLIYLDPPFKRNFREFKCRYKKMLSIPH